MPSTHGTASPSPTSDASASPAGAVASGEDDLATGAGLYACKASVDMFKLTEQDFIEQVDEVLTVGEFYELAAGGEIIFT